MKTRNTFFALLFFFVMLASPALQAHTIKIVKALVDAQRKLLPRLGTRKIYYQIKPQLAQIGIKVGRDKLLHGCALIMTC